MREAAIAEGDGRALQVPRKAIAGCVWPAVTEGRAAALLALQAQLSSCEWFTREALQQAQERQLQAVLQHAYAEVPFYRERLGAAGYRPGQPFALAQLSAVPVMTRADAQAAGANLFAGRLPAHHGTVSAGETSGSTGRPLQYRSSALEQLYWEAFTLRDHAWHRRDFNGLLAAIRYCERSEDFAGWGAPVDFIYHSGGSAILRIDTDIAAQLDWLAKRSPAYLLSYPSNLAALADASAASAVPLPGLREVRTVSELVRPELRARVREVWGVPLVDMYTVKEIGYLALQCTAHEHYHVQAENVILEILDAAGQPCAPGVAGRVVITALQKFAMPLIRYAIGDYAVPGEDCSCGRSLPVIREILGRARNMLTLPNGERRWPLCDLVKIPQVRGIRQYQFVQTSPDRLVVRLVAGPEYVRDHEPQIVSFIRTRLGADFAIDFEYCDEIPRRAGKFEDFISQLE